MSHRIIFVNPIQGNFHGKYIVGSGVGSRNRSVQKALQRRANNNTQGKPCCVNNSNVTINLLLNFQANDIRSYPGSGNTWINIGSGGTIYNAILSSNSPPTFVNNGIKSFQFTRNILTSPVSYLDYNFMNFLSPDGIGDDFTYCAWIKTTDTGFGTTHYNLMYIISSEVPGINNDFGFGIDINGKLSYGDGKFGYQDITIRTQQSVNTGNWVFVAVTRQKLTGKVVLYINGIRVKDGNCNAGNNVCSTTYILIGTESDSTGYTFGGNIGAILGNTSVLTDVEILNIFNSQKSIYGI